MIPPFLLICAVLFSFCDSSSGLQSKDGRKENERTQQNYSFPYLLKEPNAEYKLPSYLEEISGMSYYRKNKIACVQDEKAIIYILNLETELNISKYKFGKDGDYEDITIVDKTAYVLRNNGQIYKVENFRKKDRKVTKYNTPLSEKNNTEGIAYDPLTKTLLIACKESPSIDKDNSYKGYRAVYRFDLETKDLEKKPYYLINLDSLDNFRDHNPISEFSLKLAKKFHLIDSETSFKPSGIAIHPISGNIYMISNIGKLLIVMDRSGKILDIERLDIKLFRQPEGICFSPSGDLYISSEGQGGKGYILKFKPLTNE